MTAPRVEAEQVLYAVDPDGVAVLTVNRPGRRNAWTATMEHAYFDHLEAAGRDPAVRVVVVTGAGDSFCGALLAALLDDMPAQEALEFAVAASCLKHSIPGDFNKVSRDEVLRLCRGDASGRVQR